MNSAFIVETAKIVGASARGSWSQIHTFFPEDEEKRQKRGYLLAVLVVSGVAEGIEAVAVGREIIGRLHEEYFGNLEGSAFDRLRCSVEKLCREHEGLQLIGASMVENALSISLCGKGKVLLKRGDKFGILLEGKEDEVTKSASGLISPDDLYIFGSEKIFKVIAGGVLRASLETISPTEAVEVLAPIVLGREDMADAAAVVALFKSNETTVFAPFVPVVPERSTNETKEADLHFEKQSEATISPRKKDTLFNKAAGIFKFLKKKDVFVRRERGVGKKKTLLLILAGFLIVSLSVLIFNFKDKIFFQNKAVGNTIIQPISEKQQKSNEFFLSDIPVLAELKLNFPETDFVLIKKIRTQFIGFENTKMKVYLFDTSFEAKSSSSVEIGQEVRKFAAAKDKLYLLTPKGIVEMKIKDKKQSTVIKNDSQWKEIVDLAVFGGNLYLLDKAANSLWRYPPATGGFGIKNNWFKEEVDLTNATSLAIDGSVWILFKDGVKKYSFGKKESFALNNVPEGFSDPIKIFTSETEQNLYVLDKGKGKIFVIAKSGEYKLTYSWTEFGRAEDFFVSEAEKKIYLLSGQKIYEIGLR